jgi:O-antigen/teichoic acid export membrane protein
MSKTQRVFALVLAQAFNAGVNILFLPYFVRALTQAEYGIYGQVMLVGDIVRIFFSMGMATVLYVSLGRARAGEQPHEFKTIFVSAFAQGMLGFFAVLLLSGPVGGWFHNPQIGPLLRIYSLSMLFIIPYASLNALLIFLGKVRASLFVITAGLFLRVVLLVVAVEIFHSLPFVVGGLVLLSLLQLLLGLYFVPKDFLRAGRFDFALMKHRLQLGLQVGFTEVIGLAFLYTDKFMVSSLLSTETFAIYRNGTVELPVIGTLYTSVAAIVLPEISKHYSEGRFDTIVAIKRKLITLTAALLYPIVFFLIIFSHPLITAYLSEKYAASAAVFAIVSCGLFFRVNDFEDILISSARGRLVISIHSAAFALNVAVSYWLVTAYGYIGAALSALSTYTVLVAMLLAVSARLIGKSWTDFIDFKRLGLITAISGLLPAALYLAPLGAHRIPIVLACGAVSTGLAYFAFLKLSILEYRFIAPLVRKLPAAGGIIDAYLSRVFRTA